jgi:hypothetical protein
MLWPDPTLIVLAPPTVVKIKAIATRTARYARFDLLHFIASPLHTTMKFLIIKLPETRLALWRSILGRLYDAKGAC